MSRALKTTFLIHAAVAFAFGLVLFISPGRSLRFLGWAPIDPILTRLLAAALLALAWSSFRGWRATERTQVAILVEMEAVFTVVGCVGLLRHLLFAPHPAIVWVVFATLLAFGVAWITFLVKRE